MNPYDPYGGMSQQQVRGYVATGSIPDRNAFLYRQWMDAHNRANAASGQDDYGTSTWGTALGALGDVIGNVKGAVDEKNAAQAMGSNWDREDTGMGDLAVARQNQYLNDNQRLAHNYDTMAAGLRDQPSQQSSQGDMREANDMVTRLMPGTSDDQSGSGPAAMYRPQQQGGFRLAPQAMGQGASMADLIRGYGQPQGPSFGLGQLQMNPGFMRFMGGGYSR